MCPYLIKSEGWDADDVAGMEVEVKPELKLDFRPMLVHIQDDDNVGDVGRDVTKELQVMK